MAVMIDEMVSRFIQEPPKRPVSETFCYQHVLEWDDMKMMKIDPAFYMERLKRRVANELADAILEHGSFFEMPSHFELMRGTPIRMELTINDRGRYERMIPIARDEAKREGVEIGAERVKKAIPYGFELGQYYE